MTRERSIRMAFWLGAFCLVSGLAVDADSSNTRVGTCDDAKNQLEYFCNPANAASDSMAVLGTACNNPKNNVREEEIGRTGQAQLRFWPEMLPPRVSLSAAKLLATASPSRHASSRKSLA